MYDFVSQYKELKVLRSVMFPSPVAIAKARMHQKKHIEYMLGIWETIGLNFERALKETGLTRGLGDITCFIHIFGCEGWFNVLKNEIHIRITQSARKNDAETIVHELLHLITYKDTLSCREREDIVERYIGTSPFREILLVVLEH